MASGSTSETTDPLLQKERELARGSDAEEKRLSHLKSRGFSGFDPRELAADQDDLLDLQGWCSGAVSVM